jgi:hypothetical protein
VQQAMHTASMPPKKRSKADKRVFENKELLMLEFCQHDLKFRTCAGKYTYYICSRCSLRVATKQVDSGVECAVSKFDKSCESATESPVSLCVVCTTSECVYVSLPCMHKCTCAGCAKKCRTCPICRVQVSSWKKVFEAGTAGTADDLDGSVVAVLLPAVVLPEASPVAMARIQNDISSSDDDVDSSSSEEYLPQHQRHEHFDIDSESPSYSPRPHRQPQVTEAEWITRTTYCKRWSEAALVARSGNRSEALSLLESLHWRLRTCAFDRLVTELFDMGFNELPVRVCLLLHNGEKVHAIEALLQLGETVYVGVNGTVHTIHQ